MSEINSLIAQVSKEVCRWPVRTCETCHGTGVMTHRDYNGNWDVEFVEDKCGLCGGSGTYGGGQPGLHIYFHSSEEREAFKVKLLRMRGFKWLDEGNNTLETVKGKS